MNGRIFELGGGFVSEVRYERSKGEVDLKRGLIPWYTADRAGAVWAVDGSFTPSAVAAKWAELGDFTDAEHPINSEDGDMQVSRGTLCVKTDL